MSKNIRHYIGGPGHDGKQDWRTRIARDDRGTFLRTDKTNRIAAKASPEVRRRGQPARRQAPQVQRPLRLLYATAATYATHGAEPERGGTERHPG